MASTYDAPTAERDGDDWFAVNARRSGTPLAQVRELPAYSPPRHANAPLRTVHVETDMERMVREAGERLRPALMAAYAQPSGPLALMVPPMPVVPTVAMHGTPMRGERFVPKRPRAYSPKLNPVPAEYAGPLRFERTVAPPAHVAVNMHAVAAGRVARGQAEIAELEASREAARLRR
jgi:hypothetical protein